MCTYEPIGVREAVYPEMALYLPEALYLCKAVYLGRSLYLYLALYLPETLYLYLTLYLSEAPSGSREKPAALYLCVLLSRIVNKLSLLVLLL